MTIKDTARPENALSFPINRGGINNQKLALFGLFLKAFREGPRRVMLPDLMLFDIVNFEHRAVPYHQAFQLNPLSAFAAEHGIEIFDLPAQGDLESGWRYFSEGLDNLACAALLNELGPDSFACGFFRSLVPVPRLSNLAQQLAAAAFDRAGIRVAVQLRIERDWDAHNALRLHRSVAAKTEDNNASFKDIIAKVVATLPDDTARIYVISDEAALPVPKGDIRNAVRREFGVELLWKSDLRAESESASLTVLDRSILDFEMAVAADTFVGITRSTLANLAAFERYSRTRTPVQRRYVYNIPGPTLALRRDNGAFQVPALAIAENPWEPANSFHLAQIFHDVGDRHRALELYALRAAQGGEPEEVYIALYRAGQIKAALGFPVAEVTDLYLRAAAVLPHRAEASFAAARHFRSHQMFREAVEAARPAIDLPVPAEGLFVEPQIYEWMLLDEYSVSASWIGESLTCADAALKILERGKVPPGPLPRIMGTLRFGIDRLKDQTDSPLTVESLVMTSVNAAFTPGQTVRFAGADAVVVEASQISGKAGYLVECGDVRLPMWVPATVLVDHQHRPGGANVFGRSLPALLAVDNFFDDPDEIRRSRWPRSTSRIPLATKVCAPRIASCGRTCARNWDVCSVAR